MDRTIAFNTIRIQAILLIFIVLFGRPTQAIENAQAAPEFSLPGSAGTIRLSGFKGQIVYLDFWASWCAPCKKSFPWMNSMQSKFGSQGLKIIAINLDANPDDAERFLALVPANFSIAFDPKGLVARHYEVKGMPSSMLINRDGKIVFQHAGFNDATRARLEQEIQSLVERK